MTESKAVLQKGSRGGSKSSGSFQHVRAKEGLELVLLLPNVVFYGERLPGEAGECGILLVGIIFLAAAALTRSPTSGGGIRLKEEGGCSGVSHRGGGSYPMSPSTALRYAGPGGTSET